EWKKSCYDAAYKLVEHQFDSTARTVKAAFDFMPEKVTNNQIVIDATDKFCSWIEASWSSSLSVLGGPALFLPIQAFAGSAEARRILKVEKLHRAAPMEVANNVAWDFMYFAHREISYLSDQYRNDVFCTADESLADLLKMKLHTGPRFSTEVLKAGFDLPTSGHFYPLPSGRIDDSGKLAKALEERITRMWTLCSTDPNAVSHGLVR
ncbi:MAG: hypothetical protein EAZ24_14540, partial [Burkholderiales bacterium]